MEINNFLYEGISFQYPNTKNFVFSQLSGSFDFGKKYSISGPNGSGKSTLLRILSGLVNPTQGHLKINGKVVSPEKLRPLVTWSGGAPTGFYPRLTGLENLRFFCGIKSINISDQTVERVFQSVGLSREALNKNYFQYSLGMRQRLHLARILLQYPTSPIVIVDEPTNGLDKEGIKTAIDFFSKSLSMPCLQILVSHDEDFLNGIGTQKLNLGGNDLG